VKRILFKLDILKEKMKKITISKSFFEKLAIIYVICPIIVFLFGWTRFYIALITTGLLVYATYKFIKKNVLNDDKIIYIDLRILFTIIVILGIWCWTSGIGGFFVQRWDHHARNAVFRDLITYDWPVIYPKTGNGLVYYFTFWMIPALIGKIAGWTVANIALLVWSILGVILVYLGLCFVLKATTSKKLIVLLIVFIIWSGLNVAGLGIADVLGYNNFTVSGAYGWADALGGYQYTPNTGLMKWVFNQTIVPWLLTTLFLLHKDDISVYAYIGVLMLPYGPLPFVGIFLIMVLWAFSKIRKNKIILILKKSFSIPNICSILAIVPIFYTFFKCNVAANGDAANSGFGLYVPLNAFNYKYFIVLLLFFILEFGIYSLLIWKKYKTDAMFWIVNALLILIPCFRLGSGRDFCMRVSIPELFILMVYVIGYLFDIKGEFSKNITAQFLIIVLAIASLGTIGDYGEDIKEIRAAGHFPVVADDVKTFEGHQVYNDPEVWYTINFLTPYPKEKAFYKYISK
jgi:hypothetical protein